MLIVIMNCWAAAFKVALEKILLFMSWLRQDPDSHCSWVAVCRLHTTTLIDASTFDTHWCFNIWHTVVSSTNCVSTATLLRNVYLRSNLSRKGVDETRAAGSWRDSNHVDTKALSEYSLIVVCIQGNFGQVSIIGRTIWPSGLRRQLQVLVRKGVGSNPTVVTTKLVEISHLF